MSKKNITIAITVILIVFLLCLVGYYFLIGNKGGTSEIVDGFRSFLPFGGDNNSENSGSNNNNATTTNQIGGDVGNQGEFVKRLRKLSAEPVSGAGTIDTKAGTLVRYVEKATGHIYEVELFSPKKERISNTTIPLAYNAIWGNGGNSIVATYLSVNLKDTKSFSLTLRSTQTGTTTDGTTTKTELPQNISDTSVYGNNLFYLQNAPEGVYGFVSGIDGSKKKQIWYSPLTEVTSQFVNEKTIAISIKPHEDVVGYIYTVDVSTGRSKKVLGGIYGLTGVLSSDATKIIYLDQSLMKNFVMDIKSLSKTEPSFVTFPEKCVWSKTKKALVYCGQPKEYLSKNSLTNWYKGLVSTNDEVVGYDFDLNFSGVTVDLSAESGEEIDLIKPFISENGQYLIFINKKDESLWSLDLTKNPS